MLQLDGCPTGDGVKVKRNKKYLLLFIWCLMKHFLVLRPEEVTSCDRQPAGLAAPVRLLPPVVMATAGTPALIIPATLTVLPCCACARAHVRRLIDRLAD